jgi:DNA-binding IclR family transcriptional regulator
MVGLLGHIVRMYGVWLQDSLSQEYFERVCRILIYFVRWKLGETVQPGREVLIHDELSQNDIAKLLGIHRVSVTKAVSRLKELGILRRFTKTELDIADYPQLCRLGLIHLSGQDTKLPALPGFSEILFRHASPTFKGGNP